MFKPFLTLYLLRSFRKALVMTFFKLAGVLMDLKMDLLGVFMDLTEDLFVESSKGVLS